MGAICRANQRPASEAGGAPLAADGQRGGVTGGGGGGGWGGLRAPPPATSSLKKKKQLVIQQFLLSDSITFPLSLLLRPPLITSFHQGSSLSRSKPKQPNDARWPFFSSGSFCFEREKKNTLGASKLDGKEKKVKRREAGMSKEQAET